MRARPIESVFAILLVSTPARAAQVQVSAAWIRSLPAHLPAAGYFTLHNAGKTGIALIGAETGACGMLMLHRSIESGGVGGMEDVASVAVPAGATVKFAPGGYHLMCMEPTAAVTPGATVSVTLRLSDGSSTQAAFAVKNAQGK